MSLPLLFGSPAVVASCRLTNANELDVSVAYAIGCDMENVNVLDAGGFEAPPQFGCDMENASAMDCQPELRAATMTLSCEFVNGARLRARALRGDAELPPTDDDGWTPSGAAASPLWDLSVTVAGQRIQNALITALTIDLDDHCGYESCSLSFASTRAGKWPSRAKVSVGYDGQSLFRGRLKTQRRHVGTELGWSLEFVGMLNQLRDHRAFRRVYVDSDLDNWRTDQGQSTAAQVFEVSAQVHDG